MPRAASSRRQRRRRRAPGRPPPRARGPLTAASARPPPSSGTQLGLRQRDREHRARRHRGHQPAALGDQRQGVREREDAGQAGRHVLADAVADHRRRPHAPGHPEPGQRVLDGEQRGLGEAVRSGAASVRHPPRNRTARSRRSRPSSGSSSSPAAVELGAEDRLGAVELRRHAGVLGALAGEQEGHGARPRRRRRGAAPGRSPASAAHGVRRRRGRGPRARRSKRRRPTCRVKAASARSSPGGSADARRGGRGRPRGRRRRAPRAAGAATGRPASPAPPPAPPPGRRGRWCRRCRTS